MRIVLLLSICVMWSHAVPANQVDPELMRTICADDDMLCLELDYWALSPCLFVYSKQPALFGMVDRWYVYSIRGGPTLSLRGFEDLIWGGRRRVARAAAHTSELLDRIGATELRKCDVSRFTRCVHDEQIDWTICQQRLAIELAYWKSTRLSTEELRELFQSED